MPDTVREMETKIIVSNKVTLKNPLLIEGLPGVGNVGRIAAGYLVNELKMKQFAELYSPHFFPLVILHEDGVAHMLKNEFYYLKRAKRDIIILTGDTQSISPEGHYDVVNTILDFVQKLGVKEILTLGGFAEGTVVQKPRIIGAVNRPELLTKYKKYGIDFGAGQTVGTIVGASGLLLGMGRLRNIDGVCLMGETPGLPLLTDPKAADALLHVLIQILGAKVDFKKLDSVVKQMETKIRSTEEVHKKVREQQPKSMDESARYIG